MTIKEYFNRRYDETRTTGEWEVVAIEKKRMYKLCTEGGCSFAEWTIKNNVDIEVKSEIRNYFEATLLACDMEDK